MAFDFPASPTNGQVFTPPGGPTYVWQSPRWLVQGSATAQTRNRIVNPAMQISQENGDTASAASAGTSYWAADQWQSAWAATGVNNRVARSANAVVTLGSKSVNHFNTVAKASLAAGDYCHAFLQKIEGVRMADFMWGTVSAKPVVLRFSVNSSIANHVFVVHLANGDSTRNYFKLCTFTATPGSWQDFILVIPGDTTGTWATDTAAGLQLIIGIAYGSTFIGGSEGSWQGGSFHSPAGLTNFFATASQSFQFANVGLYLDPQNTGVAPAWQMPDEAQERVVIFNTGSGIKYLDCYEAS
jgi:hypothetical protein